MKTIDALVINRNADTDRLARFAESASARGIAFTRIPALDAHDPGFPFADHAALIGPHFWGCPEVKPGAIGCFLSHRRAWAALLESGAPQALICEDDAVFRSSLDRLASISGTVGARAGAAAGSAVETGTRADARPDAGRNAAPGVRPASGLDAEPEASTNPAPETGPGLEPDIIFANDRLAAWCGAVAGGAGHLPLPDVMALLAARGGPPALGLKPSPGADCYLLTRRGAARLLALTAAQRITCGVDWAMVWNALGPGLPDAVARAAFPELAILAGRLPPADPPLSAAVLSSPVAGQAGGPSVLRHNVTRPIADLLRRPGTPG